MKKQEKAKVQIKLSGVGELLCCVTSRRKACRALKLFHNLVKRNKINTHARDGSFYFELVLIPQKLAAKPRLIETAGAYLNEADARFVVDELKKSGLGTLESQSCWCEVSI